jgi:predicted CXXCH cytochrome family protein
MKAISKLIFFCLFSYVAGAQSIIDTKHNLSTSGTGAVKSTTESEICLFCHTAHNSKPQSPLWNRNDPGSTYTLYSSSTLKSMPGQPNGSSILCLSCHDGTVALGSVLSRSSTISFASTVNMPVGPSNLSTDLKNDHPISFTYDNALATSNGSLENPANIDHRIQLENNQLQCTSCHDPHKNLTTDFLVTTSENSQLCMSCHTIKNWKTSSHSTSVKSWNGMNPNPWPNTPWTTVNQNACANCHNSHNAGSSSRLLKYQTEEDNCFDCHNGNASSKNLQAEFTKTYRHDVYQYTGVHDEAEEVLVQTRHVECADCHNPHSTNNQRAAAPNVKGSNNGVTGIDQRGNKILQVSYEYEICYKCHSNNPPTGQTTLRQIVQNNVRLEFDPTNPSYHPIADVGKNTTIQGLISPLTATSIIYCTDCHASDGINSPGGPHGSIYPQILKYDYDRSTDYVNSYSSYELCYQCHDQTKTITNHNLLSNNNTHGTMTSCNNCHDPHGINGAQGNSQNHNYLINFNLRVVTKNSQNQLEYNFNSPGHGSCNLNCHNHDHVNSFY